MRGLGLVLLCGAVYRAALLVTADKITEPARTWLVQHLTGQARHHSLETVLEYDEPRAPGIDLSRLTQDAGRADYSWIARCSCGQPFVSRNGSATEAERDLDAHLARHVNLESKPAVLLTCPWCVSVWLGAPAAWSWWCFGSRGWWAVPAAALTASAAAGIGAKIASP